MTRFGQCHTSLFCVAAARSYIDRHDTVSEHSVWLPAYQFSTRETTSEESLAIEGSNQPLHQEHHRELRFPLDRIPTQ
jgi:hypothetical protein